MMLLKYGGCAAYSVGDERWSSSALEPPGGVNLLARRLRLGGRLAWAHGVVE